jgi:hypothetical protein
MTILQYQIENRFNVSCHENGFWTTAITTFIGGGTAAAAMESFISAFHGRKGWRLIAESGSELIDALLSCWLTSETVNNHRAKTFTS